MIMTLSSFIHFKLYTDCQNQNFLFCSDSDLKQNQNEMRFFFNEIRQNQFFFNEMRQNQIFFL